MICVPLHDIFSIEGLGSITECIFNLETNPPVFGIMCGVDNHHRSKRPPENLCINVACIEGFNLGNYDDKLSILMV